MGLWMAGMTGGEFPRRSEDRRARLSVTELRHEVRDLHEQIAKMALMNQALWELLRERLQVTDDDLTAIAQEIDLRDGIPDGKMSDTALRCPQCGRISNSRHWKCLYCGLEFEKPAMG